MLGAGAGEGADPDGATDGADVTDGDPLTGLAGFTEAEVAGPVEVGALVSCVLAGTEGGLDCTAPAWLRRLEQPAVVVASTTARAAITAFDIVRITLYPPAGFTSSVSHPTFIVNRRLRPRES